MLKYFFAALALILLVIVYYRKAEIPAVVPKPVQEVPVPAPTPQPVVPVPPAPERTAEKKEAAKPESYSEPGHDSNQQLELEKFRAMNQRDVARIKVKMRDDEMTSLKNSIVEDQETLKKIEASGTNIELYHEVKANLETRKKRLKQIQK